MGNPFTSRCFIAVSGGLAAAMDFCVEDLLQGFTLRIEVFSIWTTRWSFPWRTMLYFDVLLSFASYFQSALPSSLLLRTLKLPLVGLHFLDECTHEFSKLVGLE